MSDCIFVTVSISRMCLPPPPLSLSVADRGAVLLLKYRNKRAAINGAARHVLYAVRTRALLSTVEY